MRLLLLLVAASVHAVKEKATGFDFPKKNKLGALRGLGVRTKGPIKVYAVGRYDKGFLLKMKMGVGAEKMSNALVDAVKRAELPIKYRAGSENGASGSAQPWYSTNVWGRRCGP